MPTNFLQCNSARRTRDRLPIKTTNSIRSADR
jgi:hypothetical protein